MSYEHNQFLRWSPIATAPKDEAILVYCPEYQGLPELISMCLYHKDAGFCVDELRTPTHWMHLPKGPFKARA
jgi:hypothetical protein